MSHFYFAKPASKLGTPNRSVEGLQYKHFLLALGATLEKTTCTMAVGRAQPTAQVARGILTPMS